MAQNGWRKQTPELLQAETLAKVGEQLSITKSQAIVAVKKVAVHIGLKAQDLLLLDTFGAITQQQDWEQGRRPIVWPSNVFLMAQTGFSLTTLRRHLRRLCDAGVIAVHDSPNGKRWGRRNKEGHIKEAYGFDLSPMAARFDEFCDLHQKMVAQRNVAEKLRREITITRRQIRARIEMAIEQGLKGPWQRMRLLYQRLMDGLPKRSADILALERASARLKTLFSIVEKQYAAGPGCLQSRPKSAPKGTENGTHIRTTNEPHNSISTKTDPSVLRNENAPQSLQPTEIVKLMSACPEFTRMARQTEHRLRNWQDLQRAADRMHSFLGLAQTAWESAKAALGPIKATTAFALIFEKTCEGAIKCPGSYLSGMVQKHTSGELHLTPSIYARLNRAWA